MAYAWSASLDSRPADTYYNKMDDQKPSTGAREIPADWVLYKPDEPLYETLHTCVCLSELRDMSEENLRESGGKVSDPHGDRTLTPQKSGQ